MLENDIVNHMFAAVVTTRTQCSLICQLSFPSLMPSSLSVANSPFPASLNGNIQV